MKFTQILIAAAAVAGVSAQHVPITGSTSGLSGGNLPIRKSIASICDTPGPERTLYFRALQAMMTMDPNDPLSWFQVGAIHGRPFRPWNGEGPGSNSNRGYCLHGDPIFLPWHRVYSLAFEQALTAQAKKLVSSYPQSVRAQYQAAADNLRAPYWDWAASPTMPSCLGSAQVTVTVPTGSTTQERSIPNPLLSYEFQTQVRRGDFGTYIDAVDPPLNPDRTVRCSAAEGSARLAQDNLKDLVYDVFTRSKTFLEISAGTPGVSASTFENPHNLVHMDAGCGNHFTWVGSASFDPLFMLNHIQVDHLWALWEEVNPSQRTLSSQVNTGGSFSIPQGSFGPGSHLSPFYGPNDSRFTSSNVARIDSFGYTYEGIDFKLSQAERTAQVNALVNRLYGPPSSLEDDVDPEDTPEDPADPPVDEPIDPPADDPTDPPADDPTDPPVDEPADPPADEPTDPPADDPTDEPTFDPNQRPRPASWVAPINSRRLGSSPAPATKRSSATTELEKRKEDGEKEDEKEDKEDGEKEDKKAGKKDGKKGGKKDGKKGGKGGKGGRRHRFFAKIEVDPNVVPMPCMVKFFIGDSQDPAGRFALLNAPKDRMATGEVPLHRVLRNQGYHRKMTDDEIEAELDRTLSVVFELPGGSPISPDTVKGGYTVDVIQAELKPRGSDRELPSYGNDNTRRIQPDVLAETPAGL